MEDDAKLREMVLEYVKNEYIDDEEEAEELTPDTPLISGGIVDSFSMVSLKVFLEKKCQIQIPDADATPEAFDTVAKIVELVKRFKEGK
ncbi:MAG: acyl carrier protein [candidate division WOR-3 bacterium]|jgi:acyl carrier protein|nr:acyl carrier protein [candidate division WOR-3 bacterium]